MRAAFDRKLRQVRLRCSMNVLLEQLRRVLLVAGIVLLVAVLVERTTAAGVIRPWSGGVLLAAVVVSALALWVLSRPSRMRAALLLDERLRLHERFSSALALAGRDDPFARAAVREARRAAEGVHLRRRFPVRPSRRWLAAAAVWLAACAGIAFLPQMDLLGYLARREARKEEARQLQQARSEVQQAVGNVRTAVKQLGDSHLAEELAGLEQMDPAANPQDMRRQAIRRLEDLSRKIEKVQADERLASADVMQKMLRELRGSPDGLSRELDRAIAKGDFKQASELVRQLQKQLETGNLSEEQRKALAAQLSDLAKQLRELAEKNEQFKEDLEKAGLDKRLAGLSQEELREALKRQGLSEEQIEQLLRRAAACRMACSRCAGLAGALGGCCSAAGELSPEELSGLSEQLDLLEALKQDLALAQASLAEIDRAIGCLGRGQCQGQGAFREGLALDSGGGTGGPGRGFGPRDADETGETATEKTRAQSKSGQGPVIASRYFKGPQVKGESRRDFTDVVQAASDRAAEAVSEKRIPRKYESSVKKYFGRLEELGNEQ